MPCKRVFVAFAIATALVASGCSSVQKSIDAAKSLAGAGSEQTPQDKALTEKLQPGIECLNKVDEPMHESAKWFFEHDAPPSDSMIDMGTIGQSPFLTPTFQMDRNAYQKCIDGIHRVTRAEPKLPAFDAASMKYAAGLQRLHPTFAAVDEYYHEKNYKDDNYRKAHAWAVQLRPQLVALFANAQSMRAVIEVQDAGLKQRQLAAVERTEGRDGRWHALSIMIDARNLFNAGNRSGATAASLTAPLATYESAFRSARSYADAHPTNNSDPASYSKNVELTGIKDTADAYLTDGKEYRRSLRGQQTAQDRQQSLQSFQSGFNNLVSSYNSALSSEQMMQQSH